MLVLRTRMCSPRWQTTSATVVPSRETATGRAAGNWVAISRERRGRTDAGSATATAHPVRCRRNENRVAGGRRDVGAGPKSPPSPRAARAEPHRWAPPGSVRRPARRPGPPCQRGPVVARRCTLYEHPYGVAGGRRSCPWLTGRSVGGRSGGRAAPRSRVSVAGPAGGRAARRRDCSSRSSAPLPWPPVRTHRARVTAYGGAVGAGRAAAAGRRLRRDRRGLDRTRRSQVASPGQVGRTRPDPRPVPGRRGHASLAGPRTVCVRRNASRRARSSSRSHTPPRSRRCRVERRCQVRRLSRQRRRPPASSTATGSPSLASSGRAARLICRDRRHLRAGCAHGEPGQRQLPRLRTSALPERTAPSQPRLPHSRDGRGHHLHVAEIAGDDRTCRAARRR
jgi:hypothetical protein